jgi:hypothetical protein
MDFRKNKHSVFGTAHFTKRFEEKIGVVIQHQRWNVLINAIQNYLYIALAAFGYVFLHISRTYLGF